MPFWSSTPKMRVATPRRTGAAKFARLARARFCVDATRGEARNFSADFALRVGKVKSRAQKEILESGPLTSHIFDPRSAILAVFVVISDFWLFSKVNFGKIWRGKCLAEKNLEVLRPCPYDLPSRVTNHQKGTEAKAQQRQFWSKNGVLDP